MKVIINKEYYSVAYRESGWAVLTLEPGTNGPKYKKVHIYIVPQLIEERQDDKGKVYKAIIEHAAVIKDEKGNYVLVPEQNQSDNRVFVIDGQHRPGHRRWASINTKLSTANILGYTEGYGTWGAGFAFAAIFRPGDRVIDSVWRVIEYDGNEILKYQSSEIEYYSTECGNIKSIVEDSLYL